MKKKKPQKIIWVLIPYDCESILSWLTFSTKKEANEEKSSGDQNYYAGPFKYVLGQD